MRISKLCGAAPQAPVSLIVLLMCADYQLVDFGVAKRQAIIDGFSVVM